MTFFQKIGKILDFFASVVPTGWIGLSYHMIFPKDSCGNLMLSSLFYFFICIIIRGNMALLYSNTARLMRLCAQVYGNCSKTAVDNSRDEFTEQEKICFYKVSEVFMHSNCCETKEESIKTKDYKCLFRMPTNIS